MDPRRSPQKVSHRPSVRSDGGLHRNPRAPTAPATPSSISPKTLTSLSAPAQDVSGWTMIRLSGHWATSERKRFKTADPNGESTGDEFDCAPARRFDGARRSIPTGSAVRVRRFASSDRSAPLVGISMHRRLSPAHRNYNELARI